MVVEAEVPESLERRLRAGRPSLSTGLWKTLLENRLEILKVL